MPWKYEPISPTVPPCPECGEDDRVYPMQHEKGGWMCAGAHPMTLYFRATWEPEPAGTEAGS